MAAPRVVKRQQINETLEGVAQVDILNRRENVQFVRPKAGKANTVAVDGVLTHPVLGMSRSSDTLYLVAFEGKIALPDSVKINYKRGVDDLQREMIQTYAPSLSYGKLVETRKLARSLEAFQDVPPAEVMPLIYRLAESNSRRFFAPQSELSAPPTLEAVERRIRRESFRWNGEYSFVNKAQAGDLVMIPELNTAHTADQLWTNALGFIATKIYAKGGALAALVREMNRVSLQDSRALYNFIVEIQPVLAEAEKHGETLATDSRKAAEGSILEGLEELRKKKIPYAATIAKAFRDYVPPISHEHWVPIMAEMAGREAEARRKGPPAAPGSKKVVRGHAGLRDLTNWEAAANDKKAFSMCLRGVAMVRLRQIAGLPEGPVDSAVKTVTQKQLKEWMSHAATWKQAAANAFSTRQNESEQIEFTPDRKKNNYQVHFTGNSCDDGFERGARPSPRPSPSPGSAPTPSTGKSFIDYFKEGWKAMFGD
jgi:hypothetical protein